MSRLSLTTRLSIALFFGALAISSFLLQLHFRPNNLPIAIWWADGTSEAVREATETALGLTDRAYKRGRWTYRLEDYSRDSIDAIVGHPLVRLTGHIDREALRVHIDAPALPVFIRRLLEKDLGLWVSVMASAVCVLVVLLSRRKLQMAMRLRLTSGLAPLTICLLLLVYAIEMARTAWIADDAAITLRTVLNFINGYGARFNVDERVQAYTHPLWFLLISALSLISNNVFASTLWLSVACSLGALLILVRSRYSLMNGTVVAVGLLLSKAYVDFSASGLENPLSHLIVLSTAVAALYFTTDPDERRLRLLCLSVGAAYLIRADLVLIVLPLVVLVILQQRPTHGVLVRSILVGALPVLAWTATATYYYGSPFPNPAYAKLGAGVPFVERVIQGGRYFLHSVPRDPLTLAMIVLGTAVGLRGGGSGAAIAIGILLYLAYVLAIGGDFMEGRFLTCPLVLSGLLLVRAQHSTARLVTIAVCVAGLGALGLQNTLLSRASYDNGEIASDGIADERGYYFQRYGWLNAGGEVFGMVNWRIDPQDLDEIRVVCGGIGFDSVLDGPAVHYIDTCALADPLLARLPAVRNPNWRIGHFERELPSGYEESIRTRSNRLTDPRMRSYYDSIRLVTRGDLNDPKRLREVFRLNGGLAGR